MVQDLRANIISTLNNLSVTHNGSAITLPCTYWSNYTSTVLPAVFVRSVHQDIRSADTGSGADEETGLYDLALVVLDRSSTAAIDAEVFLKDATNAIQTALRAVENTLGGAWRVRILSWHDLPVDDENGVNVYQRIIQVRAFSVSTY